MAESLKNNGESTLAAAISAGASTLTVSSAVSFPTSPIFRLRIDAELLKVTAVAGGVFTVERGSEGTTATNHASGSTVRAVLTADSLEVYVEAKAEAAAAAAVGSVGESVTELEERVETVEASLGTVSDSVATLATAVEEIDDDLEEFEVATVAALGGKQPQHANLTAEAGLVGSADSAAYFTGAGAKALYMVASWFRTNIAPLANLAALKSLLGLGSAAYSDTTAFAASSHNHDAAAITTGVLDPARIGLLFSGVQVVSSGDLTALTGGQQATITAGAIVTVVDGSRWIYSGSGSKTSEASYILSADVTPDWSVIANKPSFATVATSGAYADLSGKPTLGTAAAAATGDFAAAGHTHAYVDLTGKPTLGTAAAENTTAFAAAAHTHAYNTLTSVPTNVAALAASGITFSGNTIQIGGTTSAFPMWSRSSAAIHAKLADDSAFAAVKALTFDSSIATGTAPFTVASTTVSANLNADMVDGKHAVDFLSNSRDVATGVTTTKAIDFSTLNGYGDWTLSGNCTFSISNATAARQPVSLILRNTTGGALTLTWPAWTVIGTAIPTSLAAGKIMVVSLLPTNTTTASVLASAGVQA